MPIRYVWFAWALAFLLPWALLYARFPAHRRAMGWASLFTAPFGLSEPIFVPEYWSPPSLFDLAERTGFDIESIIFSFGIGGVAAVLYDVATGSRAETIETHERQARRHRLHRWALASPFVVFPVLFILLPWNPIYTAFLAMSIGAVATALCRPDLWRRSWIGALLFVGYYWAFVEGLALLSPGYVEQVWNLEVLSGVLVHRTPMEELVFAGTFGMYWSGVFEHVAWRRSAG